jgi:hypothetical protein
VYPKFLLKMSETIKNPFTLQPITKKSHLIGRDKFYKQLENYINDSQNVLLVGGRRAGKTSLLLSLMNSGVQDTDFIYWNIAATVGDSYTYFIDLIKKRFHDNPSISCESIDHFFNDYSQSGRRLIILMDEFELLLKDDIFSEVTFRMLRSLYTPPFPISFIIASPKEQKELNIPKESGSGFLGIFFPQYLPVIDKNPEQFYELYLEACDKEFPGIISNSFIDSSNTLDMNRIYSWAGKQPYLLHQIGYEIFSNQINNNDELGKRIRKFQNLYQYNLSSWLNENYLNRSDIERLFLFIKSSGVFESDSERGILEAWGFIDERNKLNGLAVETALSSIIYNESKRNYEDNDREKILKNKYLPILEKYSKEINNQLLSDEKLGIPYLLEMIDNEIIKLDKEGKMRINE